MGSEALCGKPLAMSRMNRREELSPRAKAVNLSMPPVRSPVTCGVRPFGFVDTMQGTWRLGGCQCASRESDFVDHSNNERDRIKHPSTVNFDVKFGGQIAGGPRTIRGLWAVGRRRLGFRPHHMCLSWFACGELSGKYVARRQSVIRQSQRCIASNSLEVNPRIELDSGASRTDQDRLPAHICATV